MTRRNLGNHKYDVVKNAYSSDALKRDLARVAAGKTKKARTKLSRSRGVVLPKYTNPLDEVHFDRVEGCGMDILHQVSMLPSSVYNPYDRQGFIFRWPYPKIVLRECAGGVCMTF